MTDVLRIANCSGFFGDRLSAAKEMVEGGKIDVLTGDWLAELTMIILRRQMAKNPDAGFASTFVVQVEQVLEACLDRGIKIVSNAGGLNPAGAATAIQDVAERLGREVSVAYVDGDDILSEVPRLIEHGTLTNLDDGSPVALSGREPLVANAYLGGWGIAEALARGADIVVTGRVTDAAVIVGPAAWHFEWAREDFDALAGAVVAGHVIECGGQATGGNFAFYDEVPGIERIGFPIAEIRPDGSSVITKHEGTGGLVSVDTVTAQLLYEVGGPQYANPDVTALLDTIQLAQLGADRVQIAGVRGIAPPPTLKVSMAVAGGFRNQMLLCLTGEDPEGKAAIAEQTIWNMIPGGRDAFERVEVDLLGQPGDDPSTYGAATTLLRIAVADSNEKLVGRAFSGAVIQTGLSTYPGLFATSPPGGATSYERYIPALVPCDDVHQIVHVGSEAIEVPSTGATVSATLDPPSYDDPSSLPPSASTDETRTPITFVDDPRNDPHARITFVDDPRNDPHAPITFVDDPRDDPHAPITFVDDPRNDPHAPITFVEDPRSGPETSQDNGAPDHPATMRVPLGRLFGARSGDKGGHANLGIWARTREAFDFLDGYLSTARLRELLPDIDELKIRRYRLPNIGAINLVIEGLLGDGVSSSLRFDAQAKGLGEFVRARHIDVPTDLLS